MKGAGCLERGDHQGSLKGNVGFHTNETLHRKINIAVISPRVQRVQIVQVVQRLPPSQRPSSVAQLISFLATITSSCQHRTPFCLQCKEVQSSLVQCSVVQRSTV